MKLPDIPSSLEYDWRILGLNVPALADKTGCAGTLDHKPECLFSD